MIHQTSQQMSSNSPDKEPTSKQIDRLFLIFAAFYGHIWRSLYKNDSFLAFTKSEWQKGLVDFQEQLLDEAIGICRIKNEHPPTLPQFIDICKALKVREEGREKVQQKTFVRNMIIAEVYLKKMKAMLK
jgi:hypothetical protein